ncbi:hypothetical protein PQX77_006701 [Marasmius sp. AFHP31]|nr:hypothetical protein PQX77_006701 [Marasmius sp. AFHP31]
MVVSRCKEKNIKTKLVYRQLGGKLTQAQSRKTMWNSYQGYAANSEEELGRIAGTDCAWDGKSRPTKLQLKTAYPLFIKEHGEQEARNLLEIYGMMAEIETEETRGSCKRSFEVATTHLSLMCTQLQNTKNIHLWAAMVGGQIGSDQNLSFLCQTEESKGFAHKLLAVSDENVPTLLQSHVRNENAIKFTNRQLAAIAHKRGLTLSGYGIDDDKSPSQPKPTTTTAKKTSSSVRTAASSSSKRKKDDVCDVFKAHAEECLTALGKSFRSSTNLPWNQLAPACVDLGVQILNYPRDIDLPWTENKRASKSNRGIQDMDEDHKPTLVEACHESHKHRLTFVAADPLRLEIGELPLVITAPNNNGDTKKYFVRDIPGCLEAYKAMHGGQKKVKAEPSTDQIPAMSSTAYPTRNKPKPNYADHDDDELDQLTDQETPKPNQRTAAKPLAKKKKPLTKATVDSDYDALSPTKDPSPSKSKASAPKKSSKTAPLLPAVAAGLPPASTSISTQSTPKRAASRPAITADEFRNADFRAVDCTKLKRGAEGAGGEPLAKRARTDAQTASNVVPRAGSSSAPPPHPVPPPANPQMNDPPASANPTTLPQPPHFLQPPIHWSGQSTYPMPAHPGQFPHGQSSTIGPYQPGQAPSASAAAFQQMQAQIQAQMHAQMQAQMESLYKSFFPQHQADHPQGPPPQP